MKCIFVEVFFLSETTLNVVFAVQNLLALAPFPLGAYISSCSLFGM